MEREEEFVDIEGYEGQYQIGTRGTVISLSRDKSGIGGAIYSTKAMELKKYVDKAGYNSVVLVDLYGDKKKIDVHRLVALNFIDNPMNKPQVNHIDGNKSNNTIENLEWCTAQENCDHASMMGLIPRGERHWNARLKAQDIKDIRMLFTLGYSVKTLAEEYGVTPSYMFKIKKKLKWKHI